ncbi:MAG: metal-dependent hydrolase, partial [Staphylococcus equorum]|nr:metal-dependent hydrolase [Staphylococcus equorum]
LLSHVILDMLTPRGVKFLYPIPISVKFPLVFKTGGLVDLSLASALTIGATYVFFQPFINQLFFKWL